MCYSHVTPRQHQITTRITSFLRRPFTSRKASAQVVLSRLTDPRCAITIDIEELGTAFVQHVLGSRDRVMIIRGVAGTGKTTLEQEIGEALAEAEGRAADAVLLGGKQGVGRFLPLGSQRKREGTFNRLLPRRQAPGQ